jgi:hypothetical protein
MNGARERVRAHVEIPDDNHTGHSRNVECLPVERLQTAGLRQP